MQSLYQVRLCLGFSGFPKQSRWKTVCTIISFGVGHGIERSYLSYTETRREKLGCSFPNTIKDTKSGRCVSQSQWLRFRFYTGGMALNEAMNHAGGQRISQLTWCLVLSSMINCMSIIRSSKWVALYKDSMLEQTSHQSHTYNHKPKMKWWESQNLQWLLFSQSLAERPSRVILQSRSEESDVRALHSNQRQTFLRIPVKSWCV